MTDTYLTHITARCQQAAHFTTGDAAAIFDVSRDTIRAWIEEGRLAATNLNAGTGRKPHYQITRQAVIALAHNINQEQYNV